MTGQNNPLKHPCYEYTLDDALTLARSLKYGPFLKDSDPTPEVPEAIGIIRNSLKTCGFNWITGRVALEILRYASGEVLNIGTVSSPLFKEPAMPLELLYEIIEAFPQADPASEFYNEEIDGCEAVNFLSGFIPEVRNCLDNLRQPDNEPFETLKACWDFIENVTDDDPERTDRFFALRERVRNCFGHAEANLLAVTKQRNAGNQSGKGEKDGR